MYTKFFLQEQIRRTKMIGFCDILRTMVGYVFDQNLEIRLMENHEKHKYSNFKNL